LTGAFALTALTSASAATLALAASATASSGLSGGAASLRPASVGWALALLTLVVSFSLGHGFHLLAAFCVGFRASIF
jgi:ABC-type proline/glycine betaine transport system substrate-binding protein